MLFALLAASLLGSDPEPIAVKPPLRDKPVSYAREVAEILEGKCAGCHSEVLSEGKLRLDSVAAMLKGGKHGPALVSGKANESLLFKMAAHRVDPVMPPKDKPANQPLTPEELGLLQLWIDAGAKDDSSEVGAPRAIELGDLPSGVHPINALDMTADGKLVAVGRANRVLVYDVDSGLRIASLGGHKDIVQSVRFRPDGRALAAGSYQVVTRWNLPKTGVSKTMAGHVGPVRAMAAKADGSWLATAGDDRSIQVWDLAQGKPSRTISGSTSPILSLALSADGRTLAAGGADGTIRLLDASDWRPIADLKGDGPVLGVAFSLASRRVAATSPDGALRIWTLTRERMPAGEPSVCPGHTGPILALASAPDDRTFATGGEDKTVRLWHAEDGKALGVSAVSGPARAVAFDPVAGQIACGLDGAVALIDRDGTTLGRLDGLHAPVTSVSWNSDGSRLAASTQSGGVKIWDASGRAVAAFGHLGDDPNAPPPPIHATAFLDREALATGSAAGPVKLWTCEGAWTEAPALGPHASRVLALDYSPDGKLLAAGGGEPARSGEIKVWDTADGHLVRSAPESLHSDTVLGLAFRPDGTSVASAGADRFVKVMALADGKEVRSFEGHTGHVLSVDWSEDGKRLVSGGADNVAKLWEFETGDQIRTLTAGAKPITSVRWARGAEAGSVVGASGDRVVRFWNPGDGGIPRTLAGPADYTYCVAISRDRSRVAAGGADGVLFLWNGQTGAVLRKIE